MLQKYLLKHNHVPLSVFQARFYFVTLIELKLLCIQGWPRTHKRLACSTSPVLGLKVCATTPSSNAASNHYAVIRHHDQKQPEDAPSRREARTGTQTGTWRQELKQSHGGVLLTSLPPLLCLACVRL